MRILPRPGLLRPPWLREERGSQTLELLLVLPVFLMLLVMVTELGFVMYDFAVVNYAAASAAAQAARKGVFDTQVRQETAAYLRQWTTSGHRFAVDAAATGPYEAADAIVVWGPPADARIPLNDPITVGVVYPVRFKTLLLDALRRWTVREEVLTLRAQATALSEVHVEP